MRTNPRQPLVQFLLLAALLGAVTTAFVVERLAAQEAGGQSTPPRRTPGRTPGTPPPAADNADGNTAKPAAPEAAVPPDGSDPAPAADAKTESKAEPEPIPEFRLPPPPPDRVPPTPIELVSYRVQIPVVFQPDPLLSPAFRQDILRELARIADTNIGQMWDVEITEANWITPLSRAGIERIESEQLKRRVEEEQVIEVIREQLVIETIDRRLREELAVEVIRDRLVKEMYSEQFDQPDRDLSITPEQIRYTTEQSLSIRGDASLSAELRRRIRVMLDTDNTKEPVKDKDTPRPKTAQEELLPDIIGAVSNDKVSPTVLAEIYSLISDISIGALVSDARRVHLDNRAIHDVVRADVVTAAESRFAAADGWQLSDDLRARVRAMLDVADDDEIHEQLIGELVDAVSPEKTPENVGIAVREMLFFYLVPPALEIDKMYPVSVERRGSEYTVSAREWDRESEFISPVQSRTTIDRRAVANEIFRTIRPLFRPVMQIESADQATKTARLRYKAGEFPPGDPGFRQIEQGSMFVPFFRYLDRKKVVQRIQTLPWTYITAEKLERIRADCIVATGVGTPLGAFRARRMELRAIELRPNLPATTLTVAPKRTGTRKPLVGYLVAIYDEPPPPPPKPGTEPKKKDEDDTSPKPEPPKPDIYRSDRNGQVTVPVDPNKALQWVLIRSGGSLLTKFPFVAGAEASMLAECPDDTIRLNVEGQISLLTGRLIDTIAKRHMVMAMVKNRAKKGDWKKVDESLKELTDMESYEQFKDRVGVIQFAAIERAEARKDRRAVGRIKKLGSSVLAVAKIHLDKQKVDDFRDQIEEVKRMGVDSATALDDDDAPAGGGRTPAGGGRTPAGGGSGRTPSGSGRTPGQ